MRAKVFELKFDDPTEVEAMLRAAEGEAAVDLFNASAELLFEHRDRLVALGVPAESVADLDETRSITRTVVAGLSEALEDAIGRKDAAGVASLKWFLEGYGAALRRVALMTKTTMH